MNRDLQRIGTQLLRGLGRAVQQQVRQSSRRRTPGPVTQRPSPAPDQRSSAGYPGDFTGVPDFSYSPDLDGQPDVGEVVWAWVPFEEDHSRGKDRPVLLVGTDGPWLLGLQLTSQDHDRDADQERRAGRLWVDIGSGDWDERRRPSEVRVNRVIRIAEDAVRREGAVLPRERFDEVATAVRAALG